MKQIGLALHNYHDISNSFPMGNVAHLSGSTMYGFGWTWQSKILPEMDQAPLYKKVQNRMITDNGVWNTSEMLLAHTKTQIAIFQCPSQPGGDRQYGGMNGNQPSNYNGNIGTNVYNNCNGKVPSCTKANGIFFLNSHVRLADITDGPSNTMLVMEVQTKMSSNMPGGDRWYNFRQNGDSNPPSDLSESLIGTETNDPINGGAQEAAGSFHTGGCNVLLGDGRVQFLSQNINMTTYRRLSTRAGGEVVSNF